MIKKGIVESSFDITKYPGYFEHPVDRKGCSPYIVGSLMKIVFYPETDADGVAKLNPL
jgi:hypothetical protein